MPELEAWAFEPSEDNSVIQTSQCWNVFMQQVNSMPSSLQIIFVVSFSVTLFQVIFLQLMGFLAIILFVKASTGMIKGDIPHKVAEFFLGTPISPGLHFGTSGVMFSPCRSVPSAWVEAPNVSDMKIIFSRAADDYGKFLSEALLCFKSSAFRLLVDLPQQKSLCKDDSKDHSLESAMSMDISVPTCNVKTVEPNSKHLGTEQHHHRFPSPPPGPGIIGSREQSYLSVAISAIGYQLLYNPELRELRHATCKLKHGPSFVAETKRKKSPSGCTDGGSCLNEELGSIDLKGLIAVGLLAYNGTYTKARDVASAVKEVLRLLMDRIDAKVNLGKDPEQFSHLMHQAASLEDKIFSWAHYLRR